MKNNRLDQFSNIFATILFLIILSTSVLVGIKLRNKSNALNNCDLQNEELSILLKTSIERERVLSLINYQLLDNINLESVNGQFKPLNEVLELPAIIFYFDPIRTCPPCIDNTIGALNILGEKIGNNKIAIISKYNSINDLNLLKMKNQIGFLTFNYKETWIKILDESNLSQTQITFILDQDFRVQLPNFSSYTDSVTNDYYSKVIHFFMGERIVSYLSSLKD